MSGVKNSERRSIRTLEHDSRVTVRSKRPLLYFIFLCVCAGLCVGFLYSAIFLWEHELPSPLITFLLGAFTILTSAVILFCVWFIYRRTFIRPLAQIKYAARTVAAGDYSVRIPDRRKDGKKDEFQVLFDDFNTMVSELASTEILKTAFVSNVSHELKTPLSAIQNLSSMLQSDGLTEEERKDCAGRIATACKRLSILVTDILQLSRLENQSITPQKQTFDLNEQLSRCILGFEHVWEEKNIDVQTDLGEGQYAFGDERLLEIAWNNLLSNAFKFTPPGGSVQVILSQKDGRPTVTVKDSGCGMTEEQIKHAFDKFYQADTSHATMGNGLGLALTKRILTLHGAQIAVESSLQKGSAFTVTL